MIYSTGYLYQVNIYTPYILNEKFGLLLYGAIEGD